MAGLVVAVAALLAAEPAKGGPAPFVWPKPGLIDEVEIPAVIRADGVPVRLHTYRSRASPDQLLQAYANAFDQAGFYIALNQPRVTAEPHITALDWRTKISYSAILSPQPDGTTSCMLGEAALAKRKTTGTPTDFAPLMPGAREVARIDQETERLISFSVSASPAAVNQFYGKALLPAGFTAGPPEEANIYRRGLERLHVITRSKPNGAASVVLVHRRSQAP
jgi:hypothetical protein